MACSAIARANAGRLTGGILQEEKVTIWYTAPTAIRKLMRAGAELARRNDPSALRFESAVATSQKSRWIGHGFS
jgi:acyl-coenzyme A synthetase/AMP-(fatty) acid ligase